MKISFHNSIFHSDYNYSFHKPKNNKCSLCSIRQIHLTKESMMTKYQAHQARKERIRHHKATDKLRAIENPESIWSINFHLQKVLQTPRTKVSNLYYSRKLFKYSFSICHVAFKAAKRYMWHIGLVKKGRMKFLHFSLTTLRLYFYR